MAPSGMLTVMCPPARSAVLRMVSEPSSFTRQATVVASFPSIGISTGIGWAAPVWTVTEAFSPDSGGMGRATLPPGFASAAWEGMRMVAVSPYGLSCTVAVRPPACLMVVSVVPLGRATVLTVEPSLAVSVVVTVPSFWVSTTVLEPSGRFVVSVTAPVVLLVLVEVVEPSGFCTVVVLPEEPPEEEPPPPEDVPPSEEEPPPVAGMDSRTIS